jgi:hypothetical protein
MTATLQREPADFWDKWSSPQGTDVPLSQVELTRQPPPARRRRPLRALLRFLITIGIGVGGTLVWQAYGDEARQMAATLYPEQLGWVAPQATTTGFATPGAPATLASAPPAAPTVDQQQLNSLTLNLAAVRQSVDQLATQVASAQQQMSGDIARLQAAEQDILNKIATPPPRPAPVAARKPVPPPQAIATPPPPPPAPQAR